MKKVPKTSTAEFKREAVQLVQTSGKPIAQVARELGISDTSIHQWRKELALMEMKPFPKAAPSYSPGFYQRPKEEGQRSTYSS